MKLCVIANSKELKVAFRNLRILDEALMALREQLTVLNPELLAVTTPAYVQRIGTLQAEIASYLSTHPADISQLAAALTRQTSIAAIDALEKLVEIEAAAEMLA